MIDPGPNGSRVHRLPTPADVQLLVDVELERRVLGTCMLDPKFLAGNDLRERDFYVEAHRVIWRALTHVHAEDGFCDDIRVSAYLADHNLLTQAGGLETVLGLLDTIPYAPLPIERLRKLAIQRRLQEALKRYAHALSDPDQAAKFDAQVEHFRAELRALDKGAKQPDQIQLGRHPSELVMGWAEQGPLIRVPTGIEALDELCLGGVPVPWRVMLVGAPSAGKTFVSVSIADSIARNAEREGLCVGILAVDEEPDDITIRLAQLAGYSIAEAEARDPLVLTHMAESLKALRIRLYDSMHTIESAARDLAAWAKQEGRKAALFVDSAQAVSSEAGDGARSPRDIVEANVRAMRWAHDTFGFLVVSTVEANRASYRDDEAAETTNDMAAGAESRAIEFGAKTQLMLRTPKGHPDIVWCRVAKNRRAKKGEFWLAIDRATHRLTPCDNPRGGDTTSSTDREEIRSLAALARVEADARQLLAMLVKQPGMGSKRLRSEVKASGWGWGVDRLEAARTRLEKGLDGYRVVDRGSRGSERQWFVESVGGET